ncbi:MAG: DUF4442 domain-containing protein [Bdellovibrionaceae bacterium]|nr:DUF4442 domain-containing protein [Pseudobdellovibrionaceae bacterium]
MKAKIYIWFFRLCLNLWPCIWSMGGKVIELTPDYKKLTVRLKLNWRTRNVVGTLFGGSMYGSTDPMFMLMLMNILGKRYVVWDKGCTIRFKKPAVKPIFARFEITEEMLNDVVTTVAAKGEYTFTWMVQYKDADNIVYSEFDKVMYVATKEFYKEKLRKRR